MELIITIVSISVRLVLVYRMPTSKEHKIKRSSFITEFADYVEKHFCLNHECSSVDIVSQYNEDLFKLLDKHASQKKKLNS